MFKPNEHFFLLCQLLDYTVEILDNTHNYNLKSCIMPNYTIEMYHFNKIPKHNINVSYVNKYHIVVLIFNTPLHVIT